MKKREKTIPNKRHFWRGPIPLNICLSGIMTAKIIKLLKTQTNNTFFEKRTNKSLKFPLRHSSNNTGATGIIYIQNYVNNQKFNKLNQKIIRNNLYQSPKGAKSMDMVINFAAMLKRRYQ